MSPEETKSEKRRQRAARARSRARAVKQKAKEKPARQLEGFMEFVRTQGVVGLAVGLVLGTQIKALVDQFIASFINPILGLVLPGEGDLTKKVFALSTPFKNEPALFNYGAFIYVLISFLTVVLIIYYVVKSLKLDKLTKKP